MRDLELDLLKSFVAVADLDSFAAAADRVHRTQSAVSQQMRRLEEIVGKPLLVKNGRSKELSPDGVRLLEYARRMVTLNREAMASLQADKTAKIVRIGITDDMSEGMMTPFLERISEHHPDIQLHLRTGRSPFLMESMKRGDLDLAISTREDPRHDKTILRRSPTIWLCSHNFSYHKGTPVPLIVSDESCMFRGLAVGNLDLVGMRWRIAHLMLNFSAIRAAVQANLGITARNMEFISPSMRVLKESDGFPALPNFTLNLYIRDGSVPAAARDVFQTFKETAVE